MVVAWDTINVHSLLNQVQLKEEFKNKTYMIVKNTGTRGKLLPFWDTFLALGLLKQKLPDEIEQIRCWCLFCCLQTSIIHFGVLLSLTI